MKKNYTRPEIVFEDFTLCVGIAGNCDVKTKSPSSGNCGYPYEGGNGDTIFVESHICDTCIPDNEEIGFCYDVPVDTNDLFNS